MSIGTCYPCAKYLLLVLNLFFWVCKHYLYMYIKSKEMYMMSINKCDNTFISNVT